MCEHECRLGEGSLVPLPRTERQNPAGRRSPRRGFALAVLPFDRSIALSLKCYPTAQITQCADRVSAPARRCVATGRDLSQRRQPQNGRHDRFTNAGACRRFGARRLTENKESPGHRAEALGFQ